MGKERAKPHCCQDSVLSGESLSLSASIGAGAPGPKLAVMQVEGIEGDTPPTGTEVTCLCSLGVVSLASLPGPVPLGVPVVFHEDLGLGHFPVFPGP